MKKSWNFALLLAVLGILLVLLLILGVFLGSVKVDFKTVISGIFGKTQNNRQFIVKNIRFPRVLGAALCGAMLGLSGVVFQSVFRNPMADPYLLGVSSGASLAIALASLAGLNLGFLPAAPLPAFAGALSATAIVMAVSRHNQRTLILSGVALSSLLSSLTMLFVFLHRHELSNVIFWTMGSFSSMNMTKVFIMFIAAALSFIAIGWRSRALDLLLLDEGSARSLGLNVEKARTLLLMAATLCTSAAVCFCGAIGFAGLLAPHIARLLCGPEHKRLIPTTALTGAIIMVAADTLSRTVLGPTEIPVGVVTSILGAPLFIALASKRGDLL